MVYRYIAKDVILMPQFIVHSQKSTFCKEIPEVFSLYIHGAIPNFYVNPPVTQLADSSFKRHSNLGGN